MPFIKYFCKNGYTQTIGNVVITMVANLIDKDVVVRVTLAADDMANIWLDPVSATILYKYV